MVEKDFKKEFEEFALKIKEENNPILKDSNLEFDDFDNLINIINKNISSNDKNSLNDNKGNNDNNDDLKDLKDLNIGNDDLKDLKDLNIGNDDLKDLKELFNEDLDISKDLDDILGFESDSLNQNLSDYSNSDYSHENLLNYPNISLETDDIKMDLVLKKDYSLILGMENRKKEFIKDLKDFIDEFGESGNINELMEFYES